MHTVKLKIHNDIYAHLMFLLNSLDKQKIKIIEKEYSQKNKKIDKRLNAIKIDTTNFIFDREEANER